MAAPICTNAFHTVFLKIFHFQGSQLSKKRHPVDPAACDACHPAVQAKHQEVSGHTSVSHVLLGVRRIRDTVAS